MNITWTDMMNANIDVERVDRTRDITFSSNPDSKQWIAEYNGGQHCIVFGEYEGHDADETDGYDSMSYERVDGRWEPADQAPEWYPTAEDMLTGIADFLQRHPA